MHTPVPILWCGGRVEKQPNRTRKASEREKFHADSDTVPFQIGGKQAVRIRISVNSQTISGIRLLGGQ